MASSMIHIAVASEINKKINRDLSKLLIGTIAPDISKLIGKTKVESHFSCIDNEDIPNLEKFLNKYDKYLYDDFVIGYFIHLYTDYLWFKYFIENTDYSSLITAIDGSKLYCDKKEFIRYLYNDYTNIDIKLIDKYNLDLKIFYNELPYFEDIIEEIPMDKLDIIINRAGIIIANTKINKTYLFNIKNVESFIALSTKIISSNLYELLKNNYN